MAQEAFPFIPEGTTYPQQLRKLAEENPTKRAYIFYDDDFNKMALTRQQVFDNSRKFAAILRRHGVRKGDIVCNTLINSPERILSALGTVMAGAASMHGQLFLYDGEDLIHTSRVAKCSTMIIDPGHTNGARKILDKIQYEDEETGKIRFRGLPYLTTIIDFEVVHEKDQPSFKRGLDKLKKEEEVFEEEDIAEDDMAFIFPTSGTTGFSKQIPYSHRDCLLLSKVVAPLFGITSEHSVCFGAANMGWIGGFPGPFYLATGCTRVVIDHSRGTPSNLGHLIQKILNDIEIDCGLFLSVILKTVTKLIKSGLKIKRRCNLIATGGMPLNKGIRDSLGVLTDNLNCLYGATETGIVSSLLLKHESTFEDYCVGRPVGDAKLKIIDDAQKELPALTLGQVAVWGLNTSPYYLNEPETTKAATCADGFFLLGDIGYKDENGQFYVFGRTSDAIHRGSFIHYPGWLEFRFRKCPGVEDVAFLGVPDPVFHHELCACVIPTEKNGITIQEIKDYGESLFLTEAHEEMTACIKYVLFFESFPHTSIGKLDRKKLREEVYERLNVKTS